MNFKYLILFLITILFCDGIATAQISPGELSNAHANLEGVGNCTKCHDLGNKVTNEKCLDCHKAIKSQINLKKGFHVSTEVAGKDCFVCHNDHHGRNFQLLKFDKATFKHAITGFELIGAHAKENCKACNCRSCHKPEFIKDPELKKKSSTYLGLNNACLSCHADFHKGKFSPNCNTCHGFESFKNSPGFDHNITKYPLLGKHKTVTCEKCHKPTITNGKSMAKWEGVAFENCTNCHKDVHENKFGQNCKQCHTEESFHTIKEVGKFDHDKTDFKLLGKHQSVECKKCHKTNLIDKIKFDLCSNCHQDYHKNEFSKNGIVPDCNQCHTHNSFTESLYTIEKHNLSKFSLEGAHLATPCLACHKKQERWIFINVGNSCVDCHVNKHKGFIQEKFYPQEDCTKCHNVNTWKTINFDHSTTKFKLEGAHIKQSCALCHFAKDVNGVSVQKFEGLTGECSNCHKNTHADQFELNGKTNCTRCHASESWKKTTFDHNLFRFKLLGAHLLVKCEKCHKEVINEKGRYIEYKNNKLLCSNCHR
jgi:hypothetical protein